MIYHVIVPNQSGLMAAFPHHIETGTQGPHLWTLYLVSLSVVLPERNPALQPVWPPPGLRDTALRFCPQALPILCLWCVSTAFPEQIPLHKVRLFSLLWTTLVLTTCHHVPQFSSQTCFWPLTWTPLLKTLPSPNQLHGEVILQSFPWFYLFKEMTTIHLLWHPP